MNNRSTDSLLQAGCHKLSNKETITILKAYKQGKGKGLYLSQLAKA